MHIDRAEVGKRLTEKGATLPCYRCGKNNFTILSGVSKLVLHSDITQEPDGSEPSVPVVSVVCQNCGAVTSHALGSLGLKPE